MSVETPSINIGARIKEYRKRLEMSQADFATALGLNSAQIVSQIESGGRDLKARELSRAAEILMTSVQNLLRAEAPEIPSARWRDKPNTGFEKVEAKFCLRCERYALLEDWCGENSYRDLPKISLSSEPRIGELERAAEDIRSAMQLGGRPASSLEETLQEDYGVKIFYDSFEGTALCVSGKFGKAILLNRDDAKSHRNFSLAHELFHLLVDGVYQNLELEEKHAQIFASALLLPNGSLIALLDAKAHNGKIPVRDLVATAQEFHVSTEALLLRLCNLQRMSLEHVEDLIASGRIRAYEAIGTRNNEISKELPDRYIRLAYQAYARGRIGTVKLAEFLETTTAELDSEIWNSDVPLDEEAEVALA